MRGSLVIFSLAICLVVAQGARAQSVEDQNGCQGTLDDPCVRTGACSIQGADWTQTVTVARSDLYDTMGWPGVCDQVHVALVQGNCAPGGSQLNVTAFLQSNSQAQIPEISGPLVCNAEPEPPAAVPSAHIGMLGILAVVLLVSGWAVLRRSGRAERST